MVKTDKIREVIAELYAREVDTSFTEVMLRQVILMKTGLVDDARVKTLIKGMQTSQLIVTAGIGPEYKLGKFAYSLYNLGVKPVEEKQAEGGATNG